jgi:hypothetical protein
MKTSLPLLAAAISSIALLCGLSGTAMSQTATGSGTWLPTVRIVAAKQVTRPKHSAVVRTSQTTQTPTAAPDSVSARLAKDASTAGSCRDGCVTSFKYGNAPWHGCSISSGMLSPTCRNTGNYEGSYKTYAGCTEDGLMLGWKAPEVSWYCTSIAVK